MRRNDIQFQTASEGAHKPGHADATSQVLTGGTQREEFLVRTCATGQGRRDADAHAVLLVLPAWPGHEVRCGASGSRAAVASCMASACGDCC